MCKLISKYFIVFSALIGLLSALFFLIVFKQHTGVIILTTMTTGLIVGMIGQFLLFYRRNNSPSPSFSSTLKPELKPLPEPITSLFLYNTLHHIAALTIFDAESAGRVVEDLANFVRIVTDLRKTRSTYLGEEIRAVDLYLQIEKARLGQRLEIEKQLTQICFEIPFPSLALFPLIDGCVRLNTEVQGEPVKISILCHQDENNVILEICDKLIDPREDDTVPPNRDGIFYDLKSKMVDFYGSSVKLQRKILEPFGEHVCISIPLAVAMIGHHTSSVIKSKDE